MDILAEFLASWGPYISSVSIIVLTFIGVKESRERVAAEDTLLAVACDHAALAASHKRSQERCANLSVIVESLEAEIDKLKRETLS